jgi:hypothetical protein
MAAAVAAIRMRVTTIPTFRRIATSSCTASRQRASPAQHRIPVIRFTTLLAARCCRRLIIAL